jgi:hypothetical protein
MSVQGELSAASVLKSSTTKQIDVHHFFAFLVLLAGWVFLVPFLGAFPATLAFFGAFPCISQESVRASIREHFDVEMRTMKCKEGFIFPYLVH